MGCLWAAVSSKVTYRWKVVLNPIVSSISDHLHCGKIFRVNAGNSIPMRWWWRSLNVHNLLRPYKCAAEQEHLSETTNKCILSFNDRTIYNWRFSARKNFQVEQFHILAVKDIFTGYSHFYFSRGRGTERYEALNKTRKEHGRSVDLFPCGF